MRLFLAIAVLAGNPVVQALFAYCLVRSMRPASSA